MHGEPCRYVLVGDAQSPHLLKWARALQEVAAPALELHLLSSRGMLPEFEALIPPARRLLLQTQPRTAGGNAGVLLHLPRAARWLRGIRPTVIHAHYLTSHGTLAWLAQRLWGVGGLLVGSAWGSDILVTPQRSALMRHLTAAVLRACTLTTSDSHHMAQAMATLGARRVSVFPFGLNALPPLPPPEERQAQLYFSNRGLEPWYGIDRVIDFFAAVAARQPQARLVIAHDGSARASLQQRVERLGLQGSVTFVGLLDAREQAQWYARAQWHLSLPLTDSTSVSVLEAMAHGCIPVLSDLPANREWVEHGRNGWILNGGPGPAAAVSSAAAFLQAQPGLLARAHAIAAANREAVAHQGVFPPQVRAFLRELPLDLFKGSAAA